MTQTRKRHKVSPEQNNTRSFLGELLPVILTGLFFVCLALLLKTSWASRLYLDIRNYFLHPGPSTILNIPWIKCLVFTATGGVFIGMGIPRLWVSSLAGAVFGISVGTILSLGAASMGASLVYTAGRLLLSSWVQNRFRSQIEHWKIKFQKNCFLCVLYLRLFPLSNSTLVGLLSGSCRIPFFRYLAGSFLGFIPMTILMCSLGDGSAKGKYIQICLGIICIAAIHIFLFFNKRFRLRHALAGVQYSGSQSSCFRGNNKL